MGKGAILAIEVKPEAREPIFLALARAIIEEIERGRLKPGNPLPGTRALAKSLQLNRNTVDAAYHELTMQGWLATEPSRGTFVAADLPEIVKPAAPSRRSPDVAATGGGRAERLLVKLSDGYPDVRLVPTTAFAQAFRRGLATNAFAPGGAYGDPRGSRVLREAMSRYLRDERGLTASSDDILIARGSQMALFLAASVVAEPGAAIAVERPGYPLAWSAFRAAGASVVGVPVDAGGIDVDALEQLANTNRNLRAIYLTPHHQYPTTVTLGAARLRGSCRGTLSSEMQSVWRACTAAVGLVEADAARKRLDPGDERLQYRPGQHAAGDHRLRIAHVPDHHHGLAQAGSGR